MSSLRNALTCSLGLSMLLGASAAQAQCPGDCDENATVSMGEVVTCSMIFLDRKELTECPNADSNGDGRVPISDVVRCAGSFLFGCPSQPPTPTPTPTTVPTNTPVPPPATATLPPTPTPPPTATATASPTATPTVSLACGNGVLEADETCTSCPADCEVQPCTPSTGKTTFLAFFSASRGVTAVSVDFNYRSDLLQIPGSRNESTVRARVTGLPAGGQTIINDRDYGVRIVKSRTEALPEGQLFAIEFDRCTGAAEATLDDVACVIASCSDEFSLPVDDCLCTVMTP